MPVIDASRETVTASVTVGGVELGANNVVFAETSYNANASAAPGTCQVVVRDPDHSLSFTPGMLIKFKINGQLTWQGYLFTLERGYFFPDVATRKWTLHGVDLNILFDKLIIYNHPFPNRPPDGGGAYAANPQPLVPAGTYDRAYILNMLRDTDLALISPTIDANTKITEIDQIASQGAPFSPPDAGITLRAFFQDVSGNVQRSTPGSTIWYISPDAYLVYQEQDTDTAPFTVGEGGGAVACRDLTLTKDISSIKNDVLIFTGNLNPTPGSTQENFLYRHNSLSASIATYGRFQYSEVIPNWSQRAVNARSTKILFQQGTPAERAEFTVFKPGLYPGQLVNITSAEHGIDDLFPVRQVSVQFMTPTMAEFRVSCSFDTGDPWGLLLALKRPATRGLVRPNFQTVDVNAGNPTAAQPFTYIKEVPRALGGNQYQTTYGYIRYGITVHVKGIRVFSNPDTEVSFGFLELDPERGIFKLSDDALANGGTVYAEYHVSNNIDTQ